MLLPCYTIIIPPKSFEIDHQNVSDKIIYQVIVVPKNDCFKRTVLGKFKERIRSFIEKYVTGNLMLKFIFSRNRFDVFLINN